MRLDQALVKRELCESREEAQECIEKVFVLVDGIVTSKKTKTITSEMQIQVLQRRKFVSRGGDKLEGVLLRIYLTEELCKKACKGKTAIDIGSSTGGFTDCLLSYGVERVTAIDVGTAQFHSTLRGDTRINLFENTDIRNFKTTETFDIVVADVSFIALTNILEVILSFGHNTSEYFLLIKPQFEVGFGNTKKGIVKDQTLIKKVLESYKKIFLDKKFTSVHVVPCVLQGGDGNQEYFIYLQK